MADACTQATILVRRLDTPSPCGLEIPLFPTPKRASELSLADTLLDASCRFRRARARILAAFWNRVPANNHPSLGSLPLRRLQMRTATTARFASPSYDAPPGFLSPLTHSSTRILSAFFHAESVPEVLLSEASLSW